MSAPFDGARRDRLFLAVVSLLTFAVRLAPWRRAITPEGFLFEQQDAYYHLRRTLLFLHGSAGIDRYMSYPAGAECPWPPLYDAFVAFLSCVLGAGHPSPAVVEGVVTFLPPVLAALTSVPVYSLTLRIAGRGAALAAALFFVAMPLHLRYSIVGSGDHHAAEVFLLATLIHLFLRSAGTGNSPGFSWRSSVGAGFTLGAAVLVWQGSIVYAIVLAAGVFLCWILNILRGAKPIPDDSEGLAFRSLAVCLGVSIAVTGAGRCIFPSDTGQTVFDFGFFSWFQPAFLLLVLCAVLLAAAARRRFVRGAGPAAAGAAFLTVLLLPAVVLLVPSFRGNVAGGVGFLFGKDPWIGAISEFRPSFGPDMLHASAPMMVEMAVYAAAFFLPVVMVGAALAGRWRRGEPILETAVVAALVLMIGTFAFLQRRWANAHSLNMAIGIGWFLAALRGGTSRAPDDLAAVRTDAPGTAARRPVKIRAAATLVAGLVMAFPSIATVYRIATDPNPMSSPAPLHALRWLRENTPPTSGLSDSRERPEYAVFGNWDLGHLIQYIGERPTIVNNFGSQLRENGLADMARVYLSPDEGIIAEICSRRGIRYIVAGDMRPYLGNLSGILKMDFEGSFVKERRLPGGRIVKSLAAPFWDLPYSRMYFRDGAAVLPQGAGLARFRLIHETFVPGPGNRGAGESVKVFEFVKGARVAGRAKPGQLVTLSCRLVSDSGRPFEYRTSAVADAEGNYSAAFPYPTDRPFYGTRPVGPALAHAGGNATGFEVREKDVLEGSTVYVGRK